MAYTSKSEVCRRVARARANAAAAIRRHKKNGRLQDATLLGLRSKSLGPRCKLPYYLRVCRKGVVHGLGLVASRLFREGQPILLLTGTYKPREGTRPYAFDMKNSGELYRRVDFDMDGPMDGANMGMYLNTASSPSSANCEVLSHGPLLYLYATRNIKPGRELLLYYKHCN
jgi:hypothetical protein